MVNLTASQVYNLTGFLIMRLNYIQNMTRIATDNTLTPQQRHDAVQNARSAFEEIAKFVRTVIVRNGYTLQTTEFTDQELANFRIV